MPLLNPLLVEPLGDEVLPQPGGREVSTSLVSCLENSVPENSLFALGI